MTDTFTSDMDLLYAVTGLTSCTCSPNPSPALTTKQCFSMDQSIPTSGTVISFYMEMSYCSASNTYLSVFVTNQAGTIGALAHFELIASTGGSDQTSPFTTLVYEYGWPGFDSLSQSNQICLQSSNPICVKTVNYQANYIINLAPYASYSNLQCVSVNPFTVGLQW